MHALPLSSPARSSRELHDPHPVRRRRRGPRLRPAACSLALLLACAGGALAGQDQGPPPAAPIPAPGALRQLTFVENLGQWETPAAFVAVLGTAVVQVETDAFVVQARPEGGEGTVPLRFELEGAREHMRPRGEAQRPGLRNYYLGRDRERWRSGARGFAAVVYPGLRDGVDLRLRDGGGWLEYDLHLDPGADLSSVVLRCEGVTGLEVDAEGGLQMQTAAGVLRQSAPVTWCVLPSGETEPVECAFVVLDATRFGFRLAEHDPDLPLVIDPGLEWATFLGGIDAEVILGMARRASGEVVVAGWTSSTDFPLQSPAFPVLGVAPDGFVSVFDPTGSALAWSTYYGGSGYDYILDVAVNAAGAVFVTGATDSTDLPTTLATAWSPSYVGGAWDGFVAQFAPDGSHLYGSYLGSTGDDWLTDVEVSEPRVVSLAGTVDSSTFPTTPGAAQPTPGGGVSDYVLCRLDLDQLPSTQLVYSTYLGGSRREGESPLLSNFYSLQNFHLHVDDQGVMTVAGKTASADFPKANAFQTLKLGPADAVLARIDPSQSGSAGLVYSTLLGGGATESGTAVDVDAAGILTVGGYTYSGTFPTSPGAFQTTFTGSAVFYDAFLVRLDPSLAGASQLLYGTYLGGSGFDYLLSLEVQASGAVVAMAASNSVDLPTTCGAWSQVLGGAWDIAVFSLAPAGRGASDLLYSTYIGSWGSEWPLGGLEIVSASPALRIVAAGFAVDSPDFPTTPGAFQQAYGGVHGLALQLEINPHTYCDAAPNSAGPDGALMCGSGSVAIGDNTFTLEVSGATPDDYGLFFYGNTPVQAPFYNGTRCVGGNGIFRLQPALKLDPSGHASRLLDFTKPPAGSGPGTIWPGSTWYFQFWYRDPNGGGTGANLSNGLKATFYP